MKVEKSLTLRVNFDHPKFNWFETTTRKEVDVDPAQSAAASQSLFDIVMSEALTDAVTTFRTLGLPFQDCLISEYMKNTQQIQNNRPSVTVQCDVGAPLQKIAEDLSNGGRIPVQVPQVSIPSVPVPTPQIQTNVPHFGPVQIPMVPVPVPSGVPNALYSIPDGSSEVMHP